MAIIALPSPFYVNQFSMQLDVNIRAHASPFGGSEQIVDMLNDRWKISMEIGITQFLNAAAIEAFIAALRGSTNQVNLYHYARPIPLGTLRGTITLLSSAAAGASAVVLNAGAGQAGATLLAGDILGVNSMLLMVQSPATMNGSGQATVSVVNRLRKPLSAGAEVTWSYPVAPFRLGNRPAITYVGTRAESFSMSFAEAI